MKRESNATPASLGYRMPAEWEPHASTWLGWPHNRTDWPGKFPPIPWVYAEIVRHLAGVERVEVIAQDAAAEAKARDVLERSDAMRDTVRFHRWPTNRGWTRDFAPIFVKREHKRDPMAAINFRFNGWAKYPDWPLDQLASEEILRFAKLPAWRPTTRPRSPGAGQRRGSRSKPGEIQQIVLEGGSIDVNGRGLLLTTEECLLSETQQRNPGLAREELERIFADYLGIEKVIWLERGIAGDDTHGHIDDLARFVSPDTVVMAVEGKREDVNHQPLAANLQRLRSATDQRGQRLNVVELPMPAPVIFRRRRLPASYANFYIANRLVLVPVFNDRNDRLALNILADLFPARGIIPIYCGDLIWGLGAIHCMTIQQPG
ncbi:MAG TPA: agmatine deiminase family protein [Terriglobales bacterium]|nr:agmatine deiminase family protein [Terriglobales bacterium]